ncbi:MAG: hypothetical protein ACHQ49_13915 [Elusimicrobiota bacterium]
MKSLRPAVLLVVLAALAPAGARAEDDRPEADQPPAACYSGAAGGTVRSLSENRDRLIADLARRKSTNSCALWASLNKAERYIFLMDTTFMADKSSRIFPPGVGGLDTALDHAVALYSINGPKAGQGVDHSGRGGQDYNRIYLGFDALTACVMRNFVAANPAHDPEFNQWRKSNDTGGPHPPFNTREMIFWEKWTDANSLGPTFHHWRQDSDQTQSGIDKRVGVCGVTDPTLTELTIAFDFYHNSDPLGDYGGRGGFGWQIVDKHSGVNPRWDYTPGGCPVTAPVNDRMDGGGTFNGLGPAHGANCAAP